MNQNFIKKIFPEDFFGIPNQEKNSPKNNCKQKEHPKLLNPIKSKTKENPNLFINEIKEESIEESLECSQIKKTNLQIIVPPDNSNDENEHSTSGSSNAKISNITPSNSPLICTNIKIFSFNNNEKKNIISKDDENIFKMTPNFRETHSKKDKQKFQRPLTPNVNLIKINPSPLTCNVNNDFAHYKFNYNFEKKENQNQVIAPKISNNYLDDNKYYCQKSDKNLYQINKDNKTLCAKNTNKKINTPKNTITKKYNYFRNSCLNNEKNKNDKMKVINEENKSNKKKNTKGIYTNTNGNINIYPNRKKQRSNSAISNNITKNVYDKNNRKNLLPNIYEKKISNVQCKVEKELNNLFKNIPDNFEKDPEIKNYFHLLMKDIKNIKEVIFKKTQNSFRPHNNK